MNALVAGTLGVVAGATVTDWHWKAKERDRLAEQLAEASEQIEREQQSDDATQQVAEDVAQRVSNVQYVTRTIIKEVPVYVTREDDDRCDINRGFVRLHDAAAAGTPIVPNSTGEPDDTPSGVALSTVASTVADNYGTCHTLREQVIGWQEWYRAQRSLWAGEAPEGRRGPTVPATPQQPSRTPPEPLLGH